MFFSIVAWCEEQIYSIDVLTLIHITDSPLFSLDLFRLLANCFLLLSVLIFPTLLDLIESRHMVLGMGDI